MSYFPFFSFPYNNYYNRAYPYYKNNKVIHDVPKDSTINSSDKTYNEKKSSKYNSFANINKDQILLPNTSCLFVKKATNIVTSHAITVLTIIEKCRISVKKK